ncbi:MAG: FAD-binding oxidoreductase [Deltaproteobacteria bacterium]|nr:FAD-binding oxidoreductase [Deltaproteobacteria bacterium]
MRKIYIPDKVNMRADAVVIGGGIIGTATAYWLSKFGLKTVLVEAREGLSTFTTAASAECFRAQFTEPELAAIAKESIEVFENFAAFTGLNDCSIHIRQQGYLFITDEEKAIPDLKAAVEQQHRIGVGDTVFLTGEEVVKNFPYISNAVVGATFRQKDGWLSCHELTQGFAKASTAEFLLKTKAIGIQTDAQGVKAVATDRGVIQTRLVVDAAGPFAGVIGKMVGLDLPLELVRRQKTYIRTPKTPANAPFTIDLVNGSYWRPEAGGGLLGWVDPDEPPTPPLENPKGDYEFPLFCLEHCSRLTPFWAGVAENLKKSDINVSAGQYVYTPDGQPIIGPVEGVNGFYLNCGYWMGVMVSPATGRICAELATGKMGNNNNPFRLGRFAETSAKKGSSFLSGH